MFEVVIKEVKCIEGVPTELLTKEELDEILCKGSVASMIVQSKHDPEKTSIIEITLTGESQKHLIREGGIIGVEQKKEDYVISPDWEEAQLIRQALTTKKECICATETKASSGGFCRCGASRGRRNLNKALPYFIVE